MSINSTNQPPAFPEFVTKSESGICPTDAPLTCGPNFVESKALPLDFLLGPKTGSVLDRVLGRLIQAEAHERREGRRHFAEDLREAQIAILIWQRSGVCTFREAFIAASYEMFGCHPDRVFPKIVARRQAQLGAEYSRWYDERGNLRPDLFVVHSFPTSKKSAQSERPPSPSGDVREG